MSEERLSSLLGRLREQEARESGAPDGVEARLLTEFRRRHAPKRWTAMLAAAAMLVAALGLSWVRSGERQEATRKAEAAAVTSFFPLRRGVVLDPQETANVVRIRLRRGELRRFGLPVSQEAEKLPVEAEVLVGQDGIARAVRFVNRE